MGETLEVTAVGFDALLTSEESSLTEVIIERTLRAALPALLELLFTGRPSPPVAVFVENDGPPQPGIRVRLPRGMWEKHVLSHAEAQIREHLVHALGRPLVRELTMTFVNCQNGSSSLEQGGLHAQGPRSTRRSV